MTEHDNDLTLAYMTGYEKCKEEYKNRICENCEYFREVSDYANYCKHHETYNIIFGKYFGCNKWEAE